VTTTEFIVYNGPLQYAIINSGILPVLIAAMCAVIIVGLVHHLVERVVRKLEWYSALNTHWLFACSVVLTIALMYIIHTLLQQVL
jgi:uncharacterized protein YacL